MDDHARVHQQRVQARSLGGRGTGAKVENGFAANAASEPKNVAKPSSTAVAHGAIARSRRRVRNSTKLDQHDSSVTHSSNDPCCEDHGAATL